jgi:uncharacterized membrane protein
MLVLGLITEILILLGAWTMMEFCGLVIVRLMSAGLIIAGRGVDLITMSAM